MHHFSVKVEIFSEKGNSISSLYWINIKGLLRELPSNSLCSEAPHSAQISQRNWRIVAYLVQASAQSISRAVLLQQGQRDTAASAAARGSHFFPLFSGSNCHPRYPHLALVSSSQPFSWGQAGSPAGAWPPAFCSEHLPAQDLAAVSPVSTPRVSERGIAFLLSCRLIQFLPIWTNWYYAVEKCSGEEFWPNLTFYLSCVPQLCVMATKKCGKSTQLQLNRVIQGMIYWQSFKPSQISLTRHFCRHSFSLPSSFPAHQASYVWSQNLRSAAEWSSCWGGHLLTESLWGLLQYHKLCWGCSAMPRPCVCNPGLPAETMTWPRARGSSSAFCRLAVHSA